MCWSNSEVYIRHTSTLAESEREIDVEEFRSELCSDDDDETDF